MQDECVPIDCVVAGGGVVGLAVARAMALAGRDTILLEAGPAIGGGISSRNSEVIHAGIYYPADSLKARLCVEGKALLYAYAAERGVPHKRLGKLIVASDEAELPTLGVIRAKAARNGVGDLEAMSGAEAVKLEPALRVAGALFSPSTGIIDSHALMLALQGDFENAGGTVIARSSVAHGAVQQNGSVRLHVSGAEPMDLECGLFVNATGLHAPDLARRIEGIPAETIPTAFMCKGSYYALQGRAPFSHLVYPVPEKAGLGVHLTLDLAGQARFGPDTEWVEAEDYDVDLARAAGFYAAIRRYWPGLRDGALVPAYAGIRPKISAPDAPNADFTIGRPVPGVVNLFGIESPGLTASLAIAGVVGEMVG